MLPRLTIEDQLVPACSLAVNTASDLQLLGSVGFARLEVVKLLKELGVIVGHLELMGVWVRLRVLEDYTDRSRVSKGTNAKRVREGDWGQKKYCSHTFVDVPSSDLVVLVRIQLLLLLSGGILGLARRLRRGGGSFGRLTCLLLALLLALLELSLGDALASHFVQVEVRNLLRRRCWGGSGARVGHDCCENANPNLVPSERGVYRWNI